jgi:hypothetical protein
MICMVTRHGLRRCGILAGTSNLPAPVFYGALVYQGRASSLVAIGARTSA